MSAPSWAVTTWNSIIAGLRRDIESIRWMGTESQAPCPECAILMAAAVSRAVAERDLLARLDEAEGALAAIGPDASVPLMSESTEIAVRELLRAIEADASAGAPEIAITITPDGIEVRCAEDAP